jgi:hypothetical protein
MPPKRKKDDDVFVMPPLGSPEFQQFAFDMLENLFPDPQKRMEYVESLKMDVSKKAQQADELEEIKE